MSSNSGRWYCLRLVVAAKDSQAAVEVFWGQGIESLEERRNSRGVELIGYSESEPTLRRVAIQAQALLGKSRGFCDVQLAPYDDDSWMTTWTTYLEPQPLGRGFVLVPSHAVAPLLDGRRAIRYEPKLAFGDGAHPTTRLAAAAVEQACEKRPNCRVLDVGAGNGVLSIISHHLGARQVLGLEVDNLALEAARRNAALNGVAPERCRFSSEPLESLEGVFDVVVANIEIRPLLGLVARMRRVLASGGEWLLTGFLREATGLVESALAESGASVRESRELEGWVLFSAAPSAAP